MMNRLMQRGGSRRKQRARHAGQKVKHDNVAL
jgi:hypothetical protein